MANMYKKIFSYKILQNIILYFIFLLIFNINWVGFMLNCKMYKNIAIFAIYTIAFLNIDFKSFTNKISEVKGKISEKHQKISEEKGKIKKLVDDSKGEYDKIKKEINDGEEEINKIKNKVNEWSENMEDQEKNVDTKNEENKSKEFKVDVDNYAKDSKGNKEDKKILNKKKTFIIMSSNIDVPEIKKEEIVKVIEEEKIKKTPVLILFSTCIISLLISFAFSFYYMRKNDTSRGFFSISIFILTVIIIADLVGTFIIKKNKRPVYTLVFKDFIFITISIFVGMIIGKATANCNFFKRKLP